MNIDEFELKESELRELLINDKNANAPIFASLNNLLKFYIDNSEFYKAIDLIKEYEDYAFSEEEAKSLLDYKISSLVKIEDYNELLKILLDKKTLSIKGINLSNVLFYKAIAYEALDEVDLAIESLIEIKDDISRYALINKYLKLALLYIRKN